MDQKLQNSGLSEENVRENDAHKLLSASSTKELALQLIPVIFITLAFHFHS